MSGDSKGFALVGFLFFILLFSSEMTAARKLIAGKNEAEVAIHEASLPIENSNIPPCVRGRYNSCLGTGSPRPLPSPSRCSYARSCPPPNGRGP